MKVFRIENSVFNSNTYILSEENEDYCWLVDVGDIEPILNFVGKRQIKGVFLTHTHYDHIYGINKLVEYFPECIIYTSLHGKEGLFSDKLNFSRYHGDSITFQGNHIEILNEGDVVKLFSNLELRTIYTPGHDWSCLSYYTDDMIFTGDSYIPNIKVVSSFPKSNKGEVLISLSRLMELSKTRNVFPGHSGVLYNEGV